MNTTLQDLRYALRGLAKSPGFTAITVLTLALGIGGSTAMFGLVSGVLLNSLPYRDADHLLAVWQAGRERNATRAPVSLPDFRDWQAQATTSVEGIAAYPLFTAFQGLVLLGEGEPTELRTGYVSANFFDVLRVQATHGRTFLAEEGERGANRVVVLSNRLWRTRFGGDPSVVGRSVTLDGGPFTVIGIAPAGVGLPTPDVELWTPLSVIDSTRIPHHLRDVRWLATIARARSGRTPEQVRAELRTVARRLEATYPADNAGWNDVTVLPLQRDLVGDTSSALLILMGAVGLLLVIACANVANLLLTRGAARHREFAIRTAIGASRGRLVSQLLVESIVLGVTAGVVGLAAADWVVDTVVELAGSRLPRAGEIMMDSRVAIFALALSLVTSFAFGLFPALTVTSEGPVTTLRKGGRGGDGPRMRRVRQVLVASQFGIALSLLAAGGLLVKSLWRLSRVNPGFEAASVLAVEFVIPTSAYPQREQYRGASEAMLDRVQQVPGVSGVAAVQVVPGGGADESVGFAVPGVLPPEGDDVHNALWRAVSPDYFRVLGVPVLLGRVFSATDRGDAPPVAIASRALAQRLWPTDEPVGKRVEYNGESVEIVGVVGDVRYAGLQGPLEPVLYRPQAQQSRRRMALLVRSVSAPEHVARAVTRAIHAVDPNQPVRRVRTLDQVLETSLAESRFLSVVLGAFAVLALGLSAVGLYGVIAYTVAQRSHEIGIRMALGAERVRIFGMVLGEGLRLTAVGLAVGLFGAFAAGRVVASRLFDVGAADPLTLGVVSALLVVVGLLACYLPARRATQVDPMVTLRTE